jgi:hypothetical protein
MPPADNNDLQSNGNILIDDIPLEEFIGWYGRAETERRLAVEGLDLGPYFDGWNP